MKTIEQKAKAYDEALEKARKELQACYSTDCDAVRQIFRLFPELKESEDEKIREALIKYFSEGREYLSLIPYNKEQCVSWLEKQVEKDSQVILPTFTFDDILALQCCMETVKKVQEDKELYEQLQSLHSRIYDAYWLEKQGNPTDINPSEFDLRLNKLLKQFETLLKEELASSLSFYLNVVQNDGTYISEEKQGEQKKSYDACDSSMMDNKKSPYGEKRDFGYFEEKSADKIEPKFHEGDFIKHNKANIICKVISVNSGSYYVENIETRGRIELFRAEQSFHLWTIQDAKDGDVLVCKGDIKHSNGIKYEKICLFNNLNNAFFILTKTSNHVEEYDINVNIDYPDNTVPATKEQKEILFTVMKNAGYVWMLRS